MTPGELTTTTGGWSVAAVGRPPHSFTGFLPKAATLTLHLHRSIRNSRGSGRCLQRGVELSRFAAKPIGVLAAAAWLVSMQCMAMRLRDDLLRKTLAIAKAECQQANASAFVQLTARQVLLRQEAAAGQAAPTSAWSRSRWIPACALFALRNKESTAVTTREMKAEREGPIGLPTLYSAVAEGQIPPETRLIIFVVNRVGLY